MLVTAELADSRWPDSSTHRGPFPIAGAGRGHFDYPRAGEALDDSDIITRSIGFERDVRVDVAAMPLKRGDQFLLCSMG